MSKPSSHPVPTKPYFSRGTNLETTYWMATGYKILLKSLNLLGVISLSLWQTADRFFFFFNAYLFFGERGHEQGGAKREGYRESQAASALSA